MALSFLGLDLGPSVSGNLLEVRSGEFGERDGDHTHHDRENDTTDSELGDKPFAIYCFAESGHVGHRFIMACR